MVVFTSEDRSVVTKTAPAVDLQFFAGTFFMSISLLIFAIQILNPYGILGGIFYSLAGVKLLQNSNKGSKILDSIPVNTILLAKSQMYELHSFYIIFKISDYCTCTFPIIVDVIILRMDL